MAESNISELYLPSKYNGGVITTICSGAFAGCSSLTPVVIPGNVITIRGSAFYNCNNLNKIYLEKESEPSEWNNDWHDANTQILYYGTDWEYDANGNLVEISK